MTPRRASPILCHAERSEESVPFPSPFSSPLVSVSSVISVVVLVPTSLRPHLTIPARATTLYVRPWTGSRGCPLARCTGGADGRRDRHRVNAGRLNATCREGGIRADARCPGGVL